jgi:hypothetical protein
VSTDILRLTITAVDEESALEEAVRQLNYDNFQYSSIVVLSSKKKSAKESLVIFNIQVSLT